MLGILAYYVLSISLHNCARRESKSERLTEPTFMWFK